MDIYRRLPNTDAQRIASLNNAATKLAVTPGPDVVLSPSTISRLTNYRTQMQTALDARAAALLGRVQQVGVITLSRKIAEVWIGSFIRCFNEACDRNETGFDIKDRAAYQLDISNRVTPALNTDDLLAEWGPKIINGEAARVGAGGSPMQFPTIANVSAKFTTWQADKSQLILKETEANNAQEAISNNNPEIDLFIKRMWDEIDAGYSEDPDPGSRRDKARAWGVVYVSRGQVISVNGLINPLAIGEVPAVEGVTPSPTLIGKFKNTTAVGSGVVLRFYFAPGPGMPPGPLFVDVNAGQELEKELQELGYDEFNDTLLVQNLGPNAGAYTVSARVE